MRQVTGSKGQVEHIPKNAFGRLNIHQKGELIDALMGRSSPYKIDFLGQGGCSNVYSARHQVTGDYFAVKAPMEESKLYLDLLRQEVRALCAVSHPGIVGYRGHAIGGEFSFIALDYVPGKTLEDMFSQLNLVEYALVLAKVGLALDHCHDKDIIHRDMKPTNVLLTDRSTPVVIDFGLSTAASVRQTLIAGTPEYVSPESFTLGVPTRQADVHALGVMLFERCCGKLIQMPEDLRNSRCPTRLTAFHTELPFVLPDRNHLGEDVPPALSFVAALARHPDPALRLKSGREFHDAVVAMVD